jgi:GGDEF domain-containing protein
MLVASEPRVSSHALSVLAMVALTGLPNRRGVNGRAQPLFANAKR